MARRIAAATAASSSLVRSIVGMVYRAPPAEALGDDQSIVASPETEVASGHSINDDEQCDEPERPENIVDHCRTPNQHAAWQCKLSAAIRHNMVEEWLRSKAVRQTAPALTPPPPTAI
jgi:hypothetical protein